MDREKTLESIRAKNSNFEDFKIEHANIMLIVYYINRLKELGFIQGGSDITITGFDLAMDLIEAGWKLTSEEIMEYILGCDFAETEEEAVGMAGLTYEMQEKGFAAMLKMKEKFDTEIRGEILKMQKETGVTVEEATAIIIKRAEDMAKQFKKIK
jgi:hypothetical protein